MTSSPARRKRFLADSEVDELVAGCQTGSTLQDLAVQFSIGRERVAAYLEERRVGRRRAGLRPDRLPTAAKFYKEGRSLAKVGQHFGLSASAIRRAFLRAGIPVRPRSGM